MSLVGLGRAFNLRYRPNGPLKTFVYQKPMIPIGGRNVSYTENINIQNGPSGFWGFMSGLVGGLFGGGLFGGGLFGGGLFGGNNVYAQLNAQMAAKPQGEAGKTDEALAGLIKLHPDFKIVSNDGKFYASSKDGKGNIEASSFEEMNKLLADYKAQKTPEKTPKPDPEGPTAKTKEQLAKELGIELKDGNKYIGKDGKEYEYDVSTKAWKVKEQPASDPDAKVGAKGVGDGVEKDVDLDTPSGTSTKTRTTGNQGAGTTTRSSARKSSYMDGWYNHSADGKTTVSKVDPKQVEKAAKSHAQSAAREFTTNYILSTKYYDGLNKEQQDKLTQAIIDHNPSVFNKDGSFKIDAHGNVAMDKLDIPSINWIEDNIFGVSKDNQMNKKASNTPNKNGNTQADVNNAARNNMRPTDGKDIYYNENKQNPTTGKPGVHAMKGPKGYVDLPFIKQINQNGTYIGNDDKTYSLENVKTSVKNGITNPEVIKFNVTHPNNQIVRKKINGQWMYTITVFNKTYQAPTFDKLKKQFPGYQGGGVR